MVRRRGTQRLGQLSRPPRSRRARRQDRLLLRRRARRSPHDHVSRTARRGQPVCQRAARAGNRSWRPGRDLHADDPRASGRDARLRSDRRPTLGHLRRLLPRVDRRPRQRRGMRCARHRRFRMAPRKEDSAQTQLRHRDGADAIDRALHRCSTRRRRGFHARGARLLVGRDRRRISRRSASPRR